ncbi:MAG: hypothetical protein ACKVXR_01900 [Planctomycetota bacterium]
MKHLALFAFLALAPACTNVRESMGIHHADINMSRSQFELIKSLEGEWTGKSEGGGETHDVVIRYRVTAAGTAVEETMFPGTEHEMITLYHMDGPRLMLTHYCAAGNQPRMVAMNWEADAEVHTIRFGFDGATNLISKHTGHMHDMEMTIDGPDKMVSTWTYFQDGVMGHQAKFDMTRKSGGKVEAR